MVDKGRFYSSLDFQHAELEALYDGLPPVDPKLANQCKQDDVIALGANTNLTEGACELSEQCTFINSKLEGVSGFCLKSAVGIDLSSY